MKIATRNVKKTSSTVDWTHVRLPDENKELAIAQWIMDSDVEEVLSLRITF